MMNNNFSKGLGMVTVGIGCVAALHYGHPGIAVFIGIFGFITMWHD